MLTAEQIKARRNGIGASEIGPLCGLNPWSSPMDIWLVKTGRAEPWAGSERTELGNLLEPHILSWWAEQRGATDCRKILEPLRDAEHEWLFATPDYIATLDGEEVLAEAKYVGFRVRDQWRDNTTPEYVVAQVAIQQRVTGIQRAEVAAWIDGDYQPKRIVPCPYLPELIDDLVAIASEFWHENVLRDVPPAVDASDAWRGYLAKLYPSDRLPMIDAPAEADELVERYLRHAKAEKHARVQKEEAEHELKLLIGGHGGLNRMRQYQVSWANDRVGRVSWKDVAEALGPSPDLIQQHTGAPGRRFYVKEFK